MLLPRAAPSSVLEMRVLTVGDLMKRRVIEKTGFKNQSLESSSVMLDQSVQNGFSSTRP